MRGWVMFLIGLWLGGGGLRADYEVTRLLRSNNRALRERGAHRALWVWEAGVVRNRSQARTLLNFCLQRGVDWLFVAVPWLPQGDHGSWRLFLADAHREGIEVFALAEAAPGLEAPSWVQQHLKQIREYQEQVNPGEWFDGIVYDLTLALQRLGLLGLKAVPLPGGEAAKAPKEGGPPPPVFTEEQIEGLRKMVELLRRAQREMEGFRRPLRLLVPSSAHALRLGAVVPEGLQGEVALDQTRKPFPQHLADVADFLVFRAFADEAGKIQEAVRDLLAYANLQGKRVLVGVNTDRLNLFPLEATFFDEDQKRMEQELEEVIRNLQGEPAFGGVAIHHWASYLSLPEDRFQEGRLRPR